MGKNNIAKEQKMNRKIILEIVVMIKEEDVIGILGILRVDKILEI
jgi:hypothetical protein